MIYPFSLQQVGILLGILLIAGHLFALLKPEVSQAALKSFPRSRAAGLVLMICAGIWSFLLVNTIDLGEFAPARTTILIAIAVGTFLACIYMPEFLSVRALGMITMLAAEPLLGASFLRPEISRLLVVVLAYIWIFAGLFWVGMPWLLRDQINWVIVNAHRFRVAAIGGLAYGTAILLAAILFW